MPCAGPLNQQSWRWAHSKFLELDASMSTFAPAITKQTNVHNAMTASMSTFAGVLTKKTLYLLSASMSTFSGALKRFTGYLLTSSMSTFSGVLTKRTTYLLPASMSTFSASLGRIFGRVLSASMATFSGSLVKRTSKTFAAAMSNFSASVVKKTSKTIIAVMSSMSGFLSFLPPFSSTVLGRLFPVDYIPKPQQPGGPGTPVTAPTETIGELAAGFLKPGCTHSPNHWEIVRESYGGIAYVIFKCPTCGYVQKFMKASDYDGSTDPFNWY